jgi:hypothetical protein
VSAEEIAKHLERNFHLEIIESADEDLDFNEERAPLENRLITASQRPPTSATLR